MKKWILFLGLPVLLVAATLAYGHPAGYANSANASPPAYGTSPAGYYGSRGYMMPFGMMGMMGGYFGSSGYTGRGTAGPGQQSTGGGTVELKIYPDSKPGPDGKKHDAYVPADLTLKQGVPVRVTIRNYDDMPHSFTSPSLGLSVQAAPASSGGAPGITRFTFTPAQTGDFTWVCLDPCDLQANGWAMRNNGYMRGTITIKP